MIFVYKACKKSIVTLQLLPDSITNESRRFVVDPDHAKFRTNKAKVIKLVNPSTNESLDQDVSIHDSNFIYTVGTIVSTHFDPNLDKVCRKGIHYYKTYEAALSWYYGMTGNNYTTGTYRGWYESGQKQYESNYKDGKKDGKEEWYPDGKQEGWYENGQKKYEDNWKAGKKDGTYREWYENGQEKCEVNYKKGKMDGKEKRWYEDGQKRCEWNYKDGKEDGKQESWYQNGQKKQESNYKDEKQDGRQVLWNADGQIEQEITYDDGGIIKHIYYPGTKFARILTYNR